MPPDQVEDLRRSLEKLERKVDRMSWQQNLQTWVLVALFGGMLWAIGARVATAITFGQTGSTPAGVMGAK